MEQYNKHHQSAETNEIILYNSSFMKRQDSHFKNYHSYMYPLGFKGSVCRSVTPKSTESSSSLMLLVSSFEVSMVTDLTSPFLT